MLIVAAERAELEPVAGRLTGVRPLEVTPAWALTGRLGPLPVALAASGAGRKPAAAVVRSLAERLRLRGVVSAGWCGGLDPSLQVGQVVVADRVLSEDPPGEFPALPVPGPAATGTVLTVDRFVRTAEEKRRLRATGAAVVDMEAAGVAQEAVRSALPFFCVRVVSDRADKTFVMDFNRARRRDGRFSVGRILAQAGVRPAHWRELFEMGRASRLAARALGAFLGGCRFDC